MKIGIPRYFELIVLGNDHRKFWEIGEIRSNKGHTDQPMWFTVRWGRIGTAGQSKDFFFRNYTEAESSRASRIGDKLYGGYIERNESLDAALDKAERDAGFGAGGWEASDHATGCGCSSCVAFHDAVRVANAAVRVTNAWRGPAPAVARKCMDALESACRALSVDNTNHVPTVPDDADDLSVFHIEE